MHPGQKSFLTGFHRKTTVSAEATPRKPRNTGVFGGFCAGKLYQIRRNDVRWNQRLIRSRWKSFLICTQNRKCTQKCTQTSQLIITSHLKNVKTKNSTSPEASAVSVSRQVDFCSDAAFENQGDRPVLIDFCIADRSCPKLRVKL